MSLNLTLSAPQCPTCGGWNVPKCFNITYNLSPMWRVIYPEHSQMLPLESMPKENCVPVLETAISHMEKDPAVFIALNPANGWGSYESFLYTLKEMLEETSNNPDWTWEASR